MSAAPQGIDLHPFDDALRVHEDVDRPEKPWVSINTRNPADLAQWPEVADKRGVLNG
jgi:hypothetical protein